MEGLRVGNLPPRSIANDGVVRVPEQVTSYHFSAVKGCSTLKHWAFSSAG